MPAPPPFFLARYEVHLDPSADSIQPLPSRRAFLVQVHAEADVAQGRLAGRVEHVTSGQATHFASPQELLAFIAMVLTALHSPSADPGGPPSAPSEIQGG